MNKDFDIITTTEKHSRKFKTNNAYQYDSVHLPCRLSSWQ